MCERTGEERECDIRGENKDAARKNEITHIMLCYTAGARTWRQVTNHMERENYFFFKRKRKGETENREDLNKNYMLGNVCKRKKGRGKEKSRERWRRKLSFLFILCCFVPYQTGPAKKQTERENDTPLLQEQPKSHRKEEKNNNNKTPLSPFSAYEQTVIF